jgi:hypothetical protein
VIEGRGGEDGGLRVFSRYVVLPSGQRINVPSDPGSSAASTAAAARHKRTSNRSKTARAAAMKKKFADGRNHPPARALLGQAPGEAPQPLTLNHPASNPGRF